MEKPDNRIPEWVVVPLEELFELLHAYEDEYGEAWSSGFIGRLWNANQALAKWYNHVEGVDPPRGPRPTLVLFDLLEP